MINKLKLDLNLGGVFVSCSFAMGLNVVGLSDSGDGKTYLFSLLKSYLLENNIKFKSFD